MIRILVAEDFDLLRQDICEMLSAEPDIEVVGESATGAGIVELALSTESDLILMDIEMENLNAGIHAAERIRDAIPDQKIIFLTAHETQQMITTAMATGAVDYIVKGCTNDEILQHVRAAHDGQPMMNSKIQETILREYSRLRRSEQSLLFFINNVSQLTSAERDLVRLLLQDNKVNDIARIRCVEVVTVKTQIKGLLHKFGCSRTKEIVSMIRDLKIEHLF